MDDFIANVCSIVNICVIAYAATLLTLIALKKKRKRRSKWVRNILRKRNEEGVHGILLPKLLDDSVQYKNYFRMDKNTFKELLELIEPDLIRQNTSMRESISVSERLALTLRFLATGRLCRRSLTLVYISLIKIIYGYFFNNQFTVVFCYNYNLL